MNYKWYSSLAISLAVTACLFTSTQAYAQAEFGSSSLGDFKPGEAPVYEEETFKNPDPWEGFNRRVFAFNEGADKFLLRPLAKGYDVVTPDFLDRGVTNMFGNAGEVTDVVHNFLQLKIGAGFQEIGRILLNTTIGLAGFFDVASSMGLEKKSEDFGQTLAHWGVGSGPYLMIPFFGPSTLRDSPGLIIDGYFDYASSNYIHHVPTRNTVMGVDILNKRANLFEGESLILGDRYVFLRDAYLQRREYDINDGNVSEDSFGGEDSFGSGDW